jgi:hypothetical protein
LPSFDMYRIIHCNICSIHFNNRVLHLSEVLLNNQAFNQKDISIPILSHWPYIQLGKRVHLPFLPGSVWWSKSVLTWLSSTTILFSRRNDAGVLVRTERLRTKDITQKVKAKNYWQVL